jgi:hypothetical protein
MVARAVGAPTYHEVPALEALYLAYWSDLPTDGEFQLYATGDRGFGAVPTNDGLTVALVAWPIEEFDANRQDLLGNYLAAFAAEPTLAERIAGATRESRVLGKVMHNFYRQSHGPGWALVGDAGYHKDAVTAQGISDAFRDAESLTVALDDAFSGRRPMDKGLAGYQEQRDQTTMPMFELTCQMANFEPPPPEEALIIGAIAADQRASSASTRLGTNGEGCCGGSTAFRPGSDQLRDPGIPEEGVRRPSLHPRAVSHRDLPLATHGSARHRPRSLAARSSNPVHTCSPGRAGAVPAQGSRCLRQRYRY